MTTTMTPKTPAQPLAAPDAERVNYDARSGDVILLSIDGGEEKAYCVTATYPKQVMVLCAGDDDQGDCIRVTYEYLYNHGATYLWKTPLAHIPGGLNLGYNGDIAAYASWNAS